MKKILFGLCIVVVIIQFIRPTKNLSDDQTMALSKKYHIPTDVSKVLEVACYDCHSNKTNYPWYSNVQPFAWILNRHINDGKRHLNFSTFLRLPIAVQNHKFEEMVEEVSEKEMPLDSYTYLGLHKDAKLSEEQRLLIVNWAKTQMDTLKAQYPADSLVLKRKK